MAETLSTLSIISFVVAGVCLALSIFLWIFFKIPTVIGDLSGRTARKSIARMRAANEKTGSKGYKESKTNVERGKLTDTMQQSKKLANKQGDSDDRPDTGLLNENRAEVSLSEETGLLDSNATVLLDSEETGLLVDENVTAPLSSSTSKKSTKRDGGVTLKMLDEVILIHTDEVIG